MVNRSVCSVLSEIRKCHETQNYSYLLGLVEEVQTLVNRIEASLYDKGDVKYYTNQRIELKREVKALKKEIIDLKEKKDEIS